MTADKLLEVIKEGMSVVSAIVAELRVLLTDGAVTPELARSRIARLREGVATVDAKIDAMLDAAMRAQAERLAAALATARASEHHALAEVAEPPKKDEE